MKNFMDEEFLLSNDVASLLYHNYAEKLPIIDYHCHINPEDIAKDRRFNNITELWLSGDHYKWRAMRSAGVPEEKITGNASDYEKFRAYATVMPRLIGNPLYHWTHLELKRYFDCDLALSAATCDEIWELTAKKLAEPQMSARNLIKNSGVEVLCTTDDPADSLCHHKALAEDASFPVRVLPAFRPDKAFAIDRPGIKAYLAKLGEACGYEITDLKTLKQAFADRIEYFDSLDCRTSDHAIDGFVFNRNTNWYRANEALVKAIASDGNDVSEEEVHIFRAEMLAFLGEEYKKRGWVMQIHYGAFRNANEKMFDALGPDTGWDGIGDKISITDIAKLLNFMEKKDALPRTVIYSLNPTDNAAIGALLGCFQTSGDGMPKVMQGSAWWFNDTLHGMREQMTSLASLSVFGSFLGMLTDSRSLTSYPRHEYFRRILCDLIGRMVEEGLHPANMETLSEIVMDICYNNTKRYFKF
ncbi:MAG: glucuronate isomerase [Clostridia bacterium]|nr:glucuronate isomerase [Clostridia bacterium]